MPGWWPKASPTRPPAARAPEHSSPLQICAPPLLPTAPPHHPQSVLHHVAPTTYPPSNETTARSQGSQYSVTGLLCIASHVRDLAGIFPVFFPTGPIRLVQSLSHSPHGTGRRNRPNITLLVSSVLQEPSHRASPAARLSGLLDTPHKVCSARLFPQEMSGT